MIDDCIATAFRFGRRHGRCASAPYELFAALSMISLSVLKYKGYHSLCSTIKRSTLSQVFIWLYGEPCADHSHSLGKSYIEPTSMRSMEVMIVVRDAWYLKPIKSVIHLTPRNAANQPPCFSRANAMLMSTSFIRRLQRFGSLVENAHPASHWYRLLKISPSSCLPLFAGCRTPFQGGFQESD